MMLMSAISLHRDESLVRLERTLGESATNLVRGGPDHLRVVAHLEEVVDWRTVGKVMLLQEPRLGREHPARRSESIL